MYSSGSTGPAVIQQNKNSLGHQALQWATPAAGQYAYTEIQNHTPARCQWLRPVIPATQEAEIRKIVVQSQPGQIVHKTLSQKTPSPKRTGGVAQGIGPEFKSQYCTPYTQTCVHMLMHIHMHMCHCVHIHIHAICVSHGCTCDMHT
jgi:hypothetical protein